MERGALNVSNAIRDNGSFAVKAREVTAKIPDFISVYKLSAHLCLISLGIFYVEDKKGKLYKFKRCSNLWCIQNF